MSGTGTGFGVISENDSLPHENTIIRAMVINIACRAFLIILIFDSLIVSMANVMKILLLKIGFVSVFLQFAVFKT